MAALDHACNDNLGDLHWKMSPSVEMSAKEWHPAFCKAGCHGGWERAQMMKSCCFVLICMFSVASVHAADEQKQRRLAECDFEAEKVLAIYRVTYENGRLGKMEEDVVADLSQQRDPKATQILKQRLDAINAREEEARQRLMDKCMRVHGLRFDSSSDSCSPKGGKAQRSYYDVEPDCWK